LLNIHAEQRREELTASEPMIPKTAAFRAGCKEDNGTSLI
jgi:hypothetical protein